MWTSLPLPLRLARRAFMHTNAPHCTCMCLDSYRHHACSPLVLAIFSHLCWLLALTAYLSHSLLASLPHVPWMRYRRTARRRSWRRTHSMEMSEEVAPLESVESRWRECKKTHRRKVNKRAQTRANCRKIAPMQNA